MKEKMENKQKNTKLGFTLLELVVVVLIISILTAIALPQYKRITVKAEASQLYETISSMAKAAQTFYLIHGDWPSKFDQLDLEYNLPLVKTSVCDSDAKIGGIVRNDKYEFILGTNSSSSWATVSARFASGPYKCTGFIIHLKGASDLKNLFCFEKPEKHYTRGSKNMKGDFCENVVNYKFYRSDFSTNYFK